MTALLAAFGSALSRLAFPAAAAQSIEQAITSVANTLPGGVSDFGTLAVQVMMAFVVLADFVGAFIILRAGFVLVTKAEDAALANTRRTIIAVVAALILINLAIPIQSALLTAFGSKGPDPGGGAAILSAEVLGLINFFETFAAIVAVIIIIINGIMAVTSYADGEGMKYMKRALIGVAFGLILMVIKVTLATGITNGTPEGIKQPIIAILNYVLGFGALVATAVVIWAGISMILYVGSEEQFKKAKSLVIRVGLGLIAILTSLTIINFVIGLA